MSTLTYNEANKFPASALALYSAGALALIVHAIFFSLLYFSFDWHVKIAPNMVVEMWDSLPEPVTPAIPVIPPPIPVIQKTEPIPIPKVAEPVAPAKAEIVFKDKKKKKTESVKKIKPVLEKNPKLDEQAKKDKDAELDKQIAAVEHSTLVEERIQERQAKIRSDLKEANDSEVAKYKELIQAKISRNIIMPPDVPDTAEAKFMVIVLPGGSVMDGGVKLLKSSGNSAYDNAAERAIYKAQPLPIPQDADLAREFRELRLSVKP